VTGLLAYDFMQRALLAGSCIAVAAGLTGYFVVLRNQVFTGDALGHVAFTGGLGALVAGLPLPLGVFGASIATALGIGSLGGRARGRDVAIGTAFAWVLGVGVLLLSLYTTSRSAAAGGTAGIGILFGSIFSLQPMQALIAALAAGAGSLLLLGIARPLLFVTVDPEVAAARGVPVTAVSFLFLVLLGATVAEAVQAVGALLLLGLMVTPPAIAVKLTSRPYLGLFSSAGLALGFLWLGLALAFYLPYPPGFCIVAPAFAAYAAITAAQAVGWRPRTAPSRR
jgi:zinc/manganese transport system permease protein